MAKRVEETSKGIQHFQPNEDGHRNFADALRDAERLFKTMSIPKQMLHSAAIEDICQQEGLPDDVRAAVLGQFNKCTQDSKAVIDKVVQKMATLGKDGPIPESLQQQYTTSKDLYEKAQIRVEQLITFLAQLPAVDEQMEVENEPQGREMEGEGAPIPPQIIEEIVQELVEDVVAHPQEPQEQELEICLLQMTISTSVEATRRH